MADLRIVGVSNNQLELQAPDGSRHYLEISEDLLRAMRNREVSLPTNLSPRDIQQAIRLGQTVDDIVRETGADIELVTRFAKPILAELNHIVALARNIRLNLAGDRFADPNPVQFGEVMDERLQNNGASQVRWSAKKSLDGDWLVSINFVTGSGDGIATWSFDPKKLFLAPENEAALQLSNGVPVSAVNKTVIIPTPEVVEEPEPIAHPATFLTVVPDVVEETVIDQPAFSEDLFEEPPVTQTVLRVVEEVETANIQVVEDTQTEAIAEVPVTEAESSQEEPAHEPAKPQVNSRWAEVLFGEKEEDEETF